MNNTLTLQAELLRVASELSELSIDIVENIKACGNDADGLLDTLSMAIDDVGDIQAKYLMRYQELKTTGNLKATQKTESERFVAAAKTLLKSQAVPNLICSARRFLRYQSENIIERLVELEERAGCVALACHVLLERVKKLPLDTGGSETLDIER